MFTLNLKRLSTDSERMLTLEMEWNFAESNEEDNVKQIGFVCIVLWVVRKMDGPRVLTAVNPALRLQERAIPFPLVDECSRRERGRVWIGGTTLVFHRYRHLQRAEAAVNTRGKYHDTTLDHYTCSTAFEDHLSIFQFKFMENLVFNAA